MDRRTDSHHMPDLDGRYAREPGYANAQVARGWTTCSRRKARPPSRYVLGGGDLDGEVLDLREVLEKVVGFDYGTMISCIEGRLGYLESEDGRYLLERT